jgi:hypothetical protein
MTPEWPDWRIPSMAATEPLPGEWERLHRCLGQAIAFAKGGGSCRGYLLLCEARDRAEQALPPYDPGKTELLRYWNAAIDWFERLAPPPL